MTTEESELTFVRCPSCRSLVPAVATRCRMCGHQFTKSEAEPAHEDASQPKSRVRQRTISATKDEVEEIKRQILGGGAPAEASSEAAEGSRAGGSQGTSGSGAPGSLTSRAPSKSVRVVDEDDDVFDDDIDTTYLSKSSADTRKADAPSRDASEQASKRPSFVVRSSELANAAAASESSGPAAGASSARAGTGSLQRDETEPPGTSSSAEDDQLAASRRSVDWSTDDEEPHGDDDGDDDDEGADDGSAASPGALGAAGGERKRKRRRKKKKGGQNSGGLQEGPGASGSFPSLSQSAPEPESGRPSASSRFELGKRGSEPPAAESKSAGTPDRSSSPEASGSEVSGAVSGHSGARAGGREEPSLTPVRESKSPIESKVEEPVEAPVQRGNGMSQAEQVFHGSASRGEHQASGGSQAQSNEAEGTIIGWLIHFGGDVRGQAIEIRSGKFFIGRQKLRAGDIVVNDSSISTPHCLITSSVADGLSLQDLMSEQGTYVKRARSDSFQRLDQVTFVEHGDWVRFGGYDVMVCLVPHAQRTRRN